MKILFLLSFSLLYLSAVGQFAPQAGLTGSTAIPANSPLFAAWATHCSITRGFLDINNPSLGYASTGDSSSALGAADDFTVSLGDSGIAVLTFDHPIVNGPGPDFAVFENGFRNGADSTLAFLELAFVEVSSDGINYILFPATSLTQTKTQIANFDYIDASQINNLAGKYVAQFGTPFDLQELAGIGGLDVNNITHIRIIDVVGDKNEHSTYDSAGRTINDPYPTAFPQGGFDLDAVGVINQRISEVEKPANEHTFNIFPNPVTDQLTISTNIPENPLYEAVISTPAGKLLDSLKLTKNKHTLPMYDYPSGLYFLTITTIDGQKWVEKIIKL